MMVLFLLETTYLNNCVYLYGGSLFVFYNFYYDAINVLSDHYLTRGIMLRMILNKFACNIVNSS